MSSKLISIATLFVLCLSQISCGQASKPPLDKAQVLRDVKVQSVAGWKEVISDAGRFRILFPSDPAVKESGSASTLQGYKLMNGDVNWFANYTDLEPPIANGEAQIRDAYHQSVENLTKKGAKLLRQNDTVLNGRLGIEIVLEGRGAVSFIRSFLIGRRMYVLEVDSKKVANEDSTLPKDVQQFFDSFTFWE